VHGSGLHLGVEFVRDRNTLEPATEETLAVCDRMLSFGVIIQPAGDRTCVLRIKPRYAWTPPAPASSPTRSTGVLREGW